MVGASGALLLGAQVIYCFFLIFFMCRMVLCIKNEGKEYFKQPWNLVEIAIIITSIVAIAMFIVKELILAVVMGDLSENPGKLV